MSATEIITKSFGSMTDDERRQVIEKVHEWADGPGANTSIAAQFDRQYREDAITLSTITASLRVIEASFRGMNGYEATPGGCAMQHPTPERVEVVKADSSISDDPATWAVRPGTYTIERTDGSHRTFRVQVQASDDKFAPGAIILSYLAGRDNTGDYVGFAFLTKQGQIRFWNKFKGENSEQLRHDAEVLVSSPESALASLECARCGRTLTTPESIASGLGPECAKKGLR